MSDECVYFIQADENGPIKIGFTADDPKRRLSALQTGNAATLKLLGSIKGTAARERQLHAALSEFRLQGEWFEAHPTVLATIEDALTSEPVDAHDIGDCLHCSFCFQCQHAVGVLVRGPAANICSGCIAEASAILARQVPS